MGAKLVGQAYAFAARAHLTPHETLLLIWMSMMAMDNDPRPRYFAARETTAVALGRLIPDAVAPDNPHFAHVDAIRRAAFQRVKIATQGLVRKGAIENRFRGREGRRSEYWLTYKGTDSVPLAGTDSVPLSGTESVLRGVRNPYPQGTYEEPLGTTTGETSDPADPHVPSVDNSRRDAA